MVGVGGSSPLGRTKFYNKNSTLSVLFLFVLSVWKNFGKTNRLGQRLMFWCFHYPFIKQVRFFSVQNDF